MENFDVVQISKNVLDRLSKMDYQRIGGSSEERLIFPNIFPSKEMTEKELEKQFRISEQELRFLFVEEFLKVPNYFYSVETPTEFKYKLGETFESIICGEGRSASMDMSIFTRDDDKKYNRFLNIEFKNQNSSLFGVAKDVLKLMYEKQNGAFIILLKNTNAGTLCNEGKTGILDKLNKSFNRFRVYWQGDDKSVQLIILSLEQNENKISPVLIYRKITKSEDFNTIFLKSGDGAIDTIKGNGWEQYKVKI
jgi:hypothetical protein